MKNYSDCIEYLHELGLPIDICKKVCERYEERQDMEGLVDYILTYEMMIESCVE